MQSRLVPLIALTITAVVPGTVWAQASGGKSDPEMDAITRATELAKAQEQASKAQEAAAKAETAKIEAEIAAAKKEWSGGLTSTPPTGGSTFGTNPAKAESSLLYARAVREIATDLESRVCPVTKAAIEPSYIVTANAKFNLSDLAAYRISRYAILTGLKDTQSVVHDAWVRAPDPIDKDAPVENERAAFGAGLAAADAVIGAIAKIGGNFKTVYTFGAVTIDPDNDMLAAAVKCKHAAMIHPNAIPLLDLDAFFDPAASGTADGISLVPLVQGIESLRVEALRAVAKADALAGDERPKAKLSVAELRAAVTGANAMIGKAQALLDGLSGAAADNKAIKIVEIAQQWKLRSLLGNPATRLVVLTQTPVGAYYTKDNLWTFLGGPPLYVMGGISLSYSVVSPVTGVVDKSGMIVKHGGYRSLRAVEKLINAPSPGQ